MKVKSALLASLILINILAFISASSAGIVAYWPFDEGKGKDAKDASGNGNDGEVHDAKWVDGRFGKALEFDGNFVLVPNDDSYNFDKEQSFSIVLWINYKAKGAWQGVLQKFNGGYPFKVEVNPSNNLYFALWDRTNNPGASVGNVSGSWHHAAFVRDRSEKKLYAYLDGVLKETKDDTIAGTIKNASDLYIGARKPGTAILYYGILDEIAIYDRILSEAEINAAVKGNIPEMKAAIRPKGKLTTTWGDIKK
ncbi:MAG: LamG domain-containing protein [Candidatus Poribacteria bacterium]